MLSRGRRRPAPVELVPLVLAGATVLAQITYPLLGGRVLTLVTIATVVLFCTATLAHATLTAGPRTALLVLLVAGGSGLVAEAVGTATGVPFGPYEYSGTLGWAVLQVPVVIPLAWTMMAWPMLLLGRRLSGALLGPGGLLAGADRGAGAGDDRGPGPGAGRRPGGRAGLTALLGGLGLASWDLYLDPQMVAAGHWVFEHPEPGLPGVPGIPLTNYAGWVLVAVAMLALLDAVVPRVEVDERVPALLLAWTWLGSGLANVAFFGRPEVAAYGLVGMGLLVGPYLLLHRSQRPRTRAGLGARGAPSTSDRPG